MAAFTELSLSTKKSLVLRSWFKEVHRAHYGSLLLHLLRINDHYDSSPEGREQSYTGEEIEQEAGNSRALCLPFRVKGDPAS